MESTNNLNKKNYYVYDGSQTQPQIQMIIQLIVEYLESSLMAWQRCKDMY